MAKLIEISQYSVSLKNIKRWVINWHLQINWDIYTAELHRQHIQSHIPMSNLHFDFRISTVKHSSDLETENSGQGKPKSGVPESDFFPRAGKRTRLQERGFHWNSKVCRRKNPSLKIKTCCVIILCFQPPGLLTQRCLDFLKLLWPVTPILWRKVAFRKGEWLFMVQCEFPINE